MSETKQYITQSRENGTVQVSEDVIVSIATVAVNETEGVAGFCTGSEIADMLSLNKAMRSKGIKVQITQDDELYISCNIAVNYGMEVVNVAKAVQTNVAASVESMTGLTVTEVNVNVCSISVDSEK